MNAAGVDLGPILAKYPLDYHDETLRGRVISRARVCPGRGSEKCQAALKQFGIRSEATSFQAVAMRAQSEVDGKGRHWWPRACTKHLREP